MAFGSDNKIEIPINIIVDAARAGIAAIQKQLGDLGRGINDSAAKAKALGDKFNDIGMAGRSVAIAFGAISAAMGFLGKSALFAAGALEQNRIGFENLLGSAKAADDVIKEIRKTALQTPFEIKDLTDYTFALTTITRNGPKSIQVLKDVGDALSASGKGAAEMGLVIRNIQQIASTGKVYERDIYQFNSSLPLFKQILSDSNITIKQLKESKNASDLLFDAFRKSASEGGIAFNAMKNQSLTFIGVLSNAKDAIGDILRQLGEGMMPIIKPVMTFFVDLKQRIGELSPATKLFLGIMTTLVFTFTALATVLGLVAAALPTLATGFSFLGLSISSAFIGIGIISAVAGMVAGIATHLDESKLAFYDFEISAIDSLQNIGKFMSEFYKEPIKKIKEGFLDLGEWILRWGKKTADLLHKPWEMIGSTKTSISIVEEKPAATQYGSFLDRMKNNALKNRAALLAKMAAEKAGGPVREPGKTLSEGDDDDNPEKTLRKKLSSIEKTVKRSQDNTISDEEGKKILDEAQEKLNSISENNAKQLGLYEEFLQAKKSLREAHDNWDLIQDGNASEREKKRLERDRLEQEKVVRKTLNMTADQAKQFATWQDFMSASATSKNKEIAAIGKAMAIYNIAMKSREAAMSAYSALAGIPFVGPGLGAAAAIAAIAFGAEQISGVQKQAPALYSGGMIRAGDGTNVIVGEKGPGGRANDEGVIPLDDPETARRIQEAAGGGGNTTVILNVDGMQIAQAMVNGYNKGRNLNAVTRINGL